MTRDELKIKQQEIKARRQQKKQESVELSLEALEGFGNPETIIDSGDEFNPINYEGEMATWTRSQIKEHEAQ